MKLKIINETAFVTGDLQRVIRTVMKAEGIDKALITVKKSRARSRKRLIEIYQNRIKKGELVMDKVLNSLNHSRVHGYAWVNNYSVIMFLPDKSYACGNDGSIVLQPVQEFGQELVDNFGQILIHELGHNRGLRHKDMRVDYHNFDVGYLKGMTIRRKLAKPKHIRNLVQERYEKSLAKVREFETKKKRTDNLLKKWKKKVKYYQNKSKEEE